MEVRIVQARNNEGFNKSVALEMDGNTEAYLKTMEFVGSQHLGGSGKKGEDDDMLVYSEEYLGRW